MDEKKYLSDEVFSEQFEQFVLKNRDKRWDMDSLSANPNISMMFMTSNAEFKWNWVLVSMRASLAFITSNPSLPWCYSGLSRNPNVTAEFFQAHLNEKWDWQFVIVQPNFIDIFKILPKSLLEKAELEEAIRIFLSSNPFISLEFILSNPKLPWNWDHISKNRCITLPMIVSHPELPWCRSMVLSNPNTTMDYIHTYYPSLRTLNPFDISLICMNNSINLQFADLHPHLVENWFCISNNPRITEEFILRHASTLNWSNVSKVVKPEFMLTNIHLPWEWNAASENPNINMKFICDNPDLKWDWRNISKNSNLSLDFINSHCDGSVLINDIGRTYICWDWNRISGNKFMKDKSCASWTDYVKWKTGAMKETNCRLISILPIVLIDLVNMF